MAALQVTWKDSSDTQAYEKARIGRVFNHRRPERYPIAVIEATEESHIVQAVRLAKERKCRLSVRSGGHSWAAWSVRDDAILLDLGQYKQIDLDETTGIVKVSPSTTGRMINGFLTTKGLLFAGGHCPDVGLGGFLLQGGMGWNCKNWGWACEQVVGIDVVTADGQQLHCTEQENSELLWAARGAGPGFPAVVTRFYLQTRPAYSCMRSSAYMYANADFKKAMNWILSITDTYDPDTEIVLVASYPPDSEEIVHMVLLLAFKNDAEEAKRALQPAQDSHPPGTVNEWFNRETSLADQYKDQGAANPEGHRYRVDNAYLSNDADVASVLEEAFTTLPTKKTFSLWYSMAPGTRRPLKDMALSMQTDHYFATYSIYEDADDDDRASRWVEKVMAGVEKHAEGAYLGDSDFQVRRTRFWGNEQGARLMQLRRKWDPEGRICGYLDQGDRSRQNGLENVHEWSPKL
ncbi:fad binding domain protein [Diplodia corticola]|uniref:Fad binding domain protein n=1 Tax=Diplodia corticola TaxID=236234 RepID=A0A1J9R3Z3_9PEZI|nr:fad binding domain protein [Diplodia corticola]OJD34922.1 fad binding domain protein [Diplodia corticola]